MDPTYEYLWAAGYDLPPETVSKPVSKPAEPPKRRGKKVARAKRARAKP
jgi:hypothetical protein